MGIATGAIKYFVGVGLSAWGIMSAYLFAQSVLEPLDYLNAIIQFKRHHGEPNELIRGLFDIFITSPSDFVQLVLFGLFAMTLLWVIGMLRSR